MESESIKSFTEFLNTLDHYVNDRHIMALYRGQSDRKPLLPSICRQSPEIDSTEREKKMLEELKRRSSIFITKSFNNDWDWLVVAQHFGMNTRLLDWTTNPLVALWFACSNQYKLDQDSYVYLFFATEDLILNKEKDKSPFDRNQTRILKPNLNNERIVAQSGWFTAHKFSVKTSKFVALENNTELKRQIVEIVIPKKLKLEMLRKLSILNINNQTMFPDISGVCNHINWEFNI